MYENLFQWFVYVDVFLIGYIPLYKSQMINDNNRLLDKINDKTTLRRIQSTQNKNDQSNQMI